MLVSKERQAGRWAVALPLSTQRSGPASPPAWAGVLSGRAGSSSVITTEISSVGLHSLAYQEAPFPGHFSGCFSRCFSPFLPSSLPASSSSSWTGLCQRWELWLRRNRLLLSDKEKKGSTSTVSLQSTSQAVSHSNSVLLYKDAMILILSQRIHIHSVMCPGPPQTAFPSPLFSCCPFPIWPEGAPSGFGYIVSILPCALDLSFFRGFLEGITVPVYQGQKPV